MEKQRNKSNIKLLILIGLFLIIIILGFILTMANLIRENSECNANPFVYGANRIQKNAQDTYTICSCEIKEKDNKIDPFCSCLIGGEGIFYFDNEGIYTQEEMIKKLSN